MEFSSLDFLLHTKALLSTINYMNSAIPQDLTASKDRETQRQAEGAAAGKTGANNITHFTHFILKMSENKCFDCCEIVR